MKNNNIKTISVMLAVATILLTVAFLTITRSFALPNEVQDKIFNVRITNVNSTGISLDDVRVTNTNILFNIHLSYSNPNNSFVVDITNVGNVDAIIQNIDTSFYNDNYLFEYNNNKYYLKDLVVYNVNYAGNNATNNVVLGADLMRNDNLLVGTNNKVKINVRLKKDSELSNEQKEAIDYYLNKSDINQSISLNINYQEK